MDEKKITFIICVNDLWYYEECVRYIKELYVPDGHSIDILCIQEADSMAQGYNGGCEAADAKYKVYLHQDTFITNRNFIYDILHIFENRQIGMIGVVGATELSDPINWDTGSMVFYNPQHAQNTDGLKQDVAQKWIEVKAAGKYLLATQYDIPWQEMDGSWSNYNILQSLEMRKEGYQVVVPYQERPWCYHDGGWETGTKFSEKEETYRNITVELKGMLQEQKFTELNYIAENLQDKKLDNIAIQEIMDLVEIYGLESSSVAPDHSEWFACNDWKKIEEYYRWLRFVILRIMYEREDERIVELKKRVEERRISRDAIRKVENVCMCGPKGTQRDLFGKIKEEPLVSVVIPVYNGENIINETLDSVLSQTYYNMEVIVIDDASVDGSRERILAYNDDRIRSVFLEKNRHVCYAGNEGFKLACGKYVAVIGHDDVWETDKVEKQITFLEKHPTYNLCFSWADIIDENGQNRNRENKELYQRFCSGNYPTKKWIRKLLESNNFFCAPSVCIRREALQESGGYRYALVQLQDYDLWLRLLKTGEVYIFQEKLTRYRRFFEKGKNISEDNAATRIRDAHERQWIHYNNIKNMSAQEFLEIFSDDLKNPAATQEKEVLCEKAIWLWNGGNCFAEDMFAQLFEDEESRNILEEEYGVGLKDFYEMNTKPMLFDDSAMDVIKNKNRKLSEYEKRIERLEEELCKL